MHIDMHFRCCEISDEHDSMMNMPFQICWLWKKVNSSEDGGFQSLLDNVHVMHGKVYVRRKKKERKKKEQAPSAVPDGDCLANQSG